MRQNTYAESLVILALNNLNEQRRAVLHRRREQLQQVAVLVKVNENSETLNLVQRLLHVHLGRRQTLAQRVIVSLRNTQEAHLQEWSGGERNETI